MQEPGKLVIVSQHYPPDRSTTAGIVHAIAEHLALELTVLILSGTSGSATINTLATQPNHFPLKLIGISKQSNFENRTEWAQSKGSE